MSIAGGRHAMGGQQFGQDTVLDLRSLNRIRRFDAERGLIGVEAGIQRPELVRFLVMQQRGASRRSGYVAIRRRPWLSGSLWIFGWLYAAAMVVRYAVTMTLYPERRWTRRDDPSPAGPG